MSNPAPVEADKELDYILKSHACTQINYDKFSQEDYPKMFTALLAWRDKAVVAELERWKAFFGADKFLVKEAEERIKELKGKPDNE